MSGETRLDAPSLSAEKPIELAPIRRLLLTPTEAAAALRVSQRLLWTLTKNGEIPAIRIRRLVRYSVAALENWVEQH